MSTFLERLMAIRMRDWTPKILAVMTIFGYFAIQWYILTNIIEPSMREMVMRSLGTLDTLVGLIFSYYYGASDFMQTKQPTVIEKTNEE